MPGDPSGGGFFDRFVLEFQAGNWLLLVWLTGLLVCVYLVVRLVFARRASGAMVWLVGLALALVLLGWRFAVVWASTGPAGDADLRAHYLRQAINGWALDEIHSNLARACPRLGEVDKDGEPLLSWLETRFVGGMWRIRRGYEQAAAGLVGFPADFAEDGSGSDTYIAIKPLVRRFVLVIWEEDLVHRCRFGR